MRWPLNLPKGIVERFEAVGEGVSDVFRVE